MKRGEVLVRAQDDTNKWGNADVLDLDDASFRAFVIEMFIRKGMVAATDKRLVPYEQDDIRYRTTRQFDRN